MAQQYGIKLFVVDYLQLLHSTARRAENRQQEIADISSGIKALAKELNVPVIVLSQLNRELENARRAASRGCRTCGNRARSNRMPTWWVCSTSRSSGDDDEGGGAAEEEAVPMNLLIAKQRNGPTGDVNLTFLKSYTRFESAAKVSDEDVPN